MKKMIAILLVLATVLGLAGCSLDLFGKNEETQAAAEGALKRITVMVIHKDGTVKEFSYETKEQYLGPVVQADGLVEGNAGPYGLEITKVDGEQAIYNEDKAYWALYEGEEYALQGIDTTPLVDGGVYKLEYTGA